MRRSIYRTSSIKPSYSPRELQYSLSGLENGRGLTDKNDPHENSGGRGLFFKS